MEKKEIITKSDLETGMIVELRDGRKYSVIKNIKTRECSGDYIINHEIGHGIPLDIYQENLLVKKDYIEEDIMKVYRATDYFGVQKPSEFSASDLIWERKLVTEITISQIEELLGTKLRIVAETLKN